MEPVTLSLIGGALMWLLDQKQDSPVGRALAPRPKPLPNPPQFTADQLDLFAKLSGDARVFDAEKSRAIERLLSSRSAVPVDAGPLSQMGSVWRVMPPQQGSPPASAIMREARQSGSVLLGSLSLIFLPTGLDVPMLLVAGPKGCETLAGPGGHFALFATEAVVTPPPERAKVVSNGVAKAKDADTIVAAAEALAQDRGA